MSTDSGRLLERPAVMGGYASESVITPPSLKPLEADAKLGRIISGIFTGNVGQEADGTVRVAQPWRQAPASKPTGSRVNVIHSGDLLIIDVPPDGLTGTSASFLAEISVTSPQKVFIFTI